MTTATDHAAGAFRLSRNADTAFAGRVLTLLEAAGYPYAPRHLGVDDQNRDVLTVIAGGTNDHPGLREEGAYRLGGAMLHDLHDITAGHRLAVGRECILHGEPAPFNTVFRQGLPVAFVDWSSCRPGERLEDLGYLAWTWCIQAWGDITITDQAEHLRELRDGYGDVSAARLLDAMIHRQTEVIHAESAVRTDSRRPPQRRHQAARAVEWATADRALIRRHEQTLLTALT